MSIYLLFFLLAMLIIFWYAIEELELENKTNNSEILEINKELSNNKEKNVKLIFGTKNSRKRRKILFFGLGIFVIGLYNFSNFTYNIIRYNGIFKTLSIMIIISSLLILFLIARDNFLSNKDEFIVFRIIGFIISLVFGGFFLGIFVNIVLFTALDRAITLYPKNEFIAEFKVVSKKKYNHHGEHYEIKTVGVNNKFFTFNVNKSTYEQIEKDKKIKVKYYVTDNKTIYLKNGENPYK